MNKTQHPFMQLLVLAAAFLFMTLVANLITFLLSRIGVDPASGVGTYTVQAVGQVLMFLVPVLIVARRYYRGSEAGFLRLRANGHAWGMAAAAAAAVLLLVPAIDWLTAWNDTWDLGVAEAPLRKMQSESEAVMDRLLVGSSVGTLVVNLLVVALLPALCEELFFRAGVQNLLARWLGADGRRWGLHLAVWITAFVFSLAHAEVYSFIPRLLLGALLGYLYAFGGSLLVNAAAHFVNNAAVVLVYWLCARGVLDLDPSEPFLFSATLTFCCSLSALMLLAVSVFRRQPPRAA